MQLYNEVNDLKQKLAFTTIFEFFLLKNHSIRKRMRYPLKIICVEKRNKDKTKIGICHCTKHSYIINNEEGVISEFVLLSCVGWIMLNKFIFKICYFFFSLVNYMIEVYFAFGSYAYLFVFFYFRRKLKRRMAIILKRCCGINQRAWRMMR